MEQCYEIYLYFSKGDLCKSRFFPQFNFDNKFYFKYYFLKTSYIYVCEVDVKKYFASMYAILMRALSTLLTSCKFIERFIEKIRYFISHYVYKPQGMKLFMEKITN